MPKSKRKVLQHTENFQSKADLEARNTALKAENDELMSAGQELVDHFDHVLSVISPLAPSAICIDHERIGILVPGDAGLETSMHLSRPSAEYLRNQLTTALHLQASAIVSHDKRVERRSSLGNIEAIFEPQNSRPIKSVAQRG